MDINTKLIWLDMEMTGLEVKSNVILQIAIIITDGSLNELHPGVNFIVNQPKSAFDKMDEWNIKQHGESGLIEKCLNSPLKLKQAEQLCIDYVLEYTEKGESPLCGNTILQDRAYKKKRVNDRDFCMNICLNFQNLCTTALAQPTTIKIAIKK